MLARGFALAVVLAGCGGEGEGGPDAATGDQPPGSPVPASCTDLPSLPRDFQRTITSSGLERTFLVHLPPGYDPAVPAPVLLNFHGYQSNASQQQLLANTDGKADEAGFISVHPEGTGDAASWNAGACCGEAAATGVDDVQFVRDMLDALQAELCIDRSRVHSTGMSNGGFLSHRLACELPERIAAIGPVAGTLAIADCTPSRPVPVVHFHGTADELVPYDGDPALSFPSVPDSLAAWAQRNGCDTETEEIYRQGDSSCVAYLGCPAGGEVVLCTVEDGGHTWPGGLPFPALGKTTQDLSATDFMWNFMKTVRHPSPE